jgi:hypothetical protein
MMKVELIVVFFFDASSEHGGIVDEMLLGCII